MAKKEKMTEVFLKQRRPHATGFRLGRHLIVLGAAKPYMLNESELKELDTTGPKAWLKVVSKKQAENNTQSNEENKIKMELVKAVEAFYELTGEETIEELTELRNDIEMINSLREELAKRNVEVPVDATIEELEALLK